MKMTLAYALMTVIAGGALTLVMTDDPNEDAAFTDRAGGDASSLPLLPDAVLHEFPRSPVTTNHSAHTDVPQTPEVPTGQSKAEGGGVERLVIWKNGIASGWVEVPRRTHAQYEQMLAMAKAEPEFQAAGRIIDFPAPKARRDVTYRPPKYLDPPGSRRITKFHQPDWLNIWGRTLDKRRRDNQDYARDRELRTARDRRRR